MSTVMYCCDSQPTGLIVISRGNLLCYKLRSYQKDTQKYIAVKVVCISIVGHFKHYCCLSETCVFCTEITYFLIT